MEGAPPSGIVFGFDADLTGPVVGGIKTLLFTTWVSRNGERTTIYRGESIQVARNLYEYWCRQPIEEPVR